MLVETALGIVVLGGIVLLARPCKRLSDMNWPLVVVLVFWLFVLYNLFWR